MSAESIYRGSHGPHMQVVHTGHASLTSQKVLEARRAQRAGGEQGKGRPIGTRRAGARISDSTKNGKYSGGFFKELRGEGICGVDPLDLHAVSIFECPVVNPALG